MPSSLRGSVAADVIGRGVRSALERPRGRLLTREDPGGRDLEAAHGLLFLLTLPSLLLLPRELWRWPFPLLVPVSIYAAVVFLSRPLRETASWLRAGALSPRLVGWSILVALVSSGVLVLYQVLLAPELSYMDRYLPTPRSSSSRRGG